jgi:hypothetical protein
MPKPEGIIKRGNINLRWEDGVDNDVKAMGKGNWENLDRNRQLWQKLMAQKGLFANDDRWIIFPGICTDYFQFKHLETQIIVFPQT